MAKSGNKIDSNVTGLAFAEEVALKELPNGVVGDQTIGAFAGNADFASIDLVWDDVTKQLAITATVVAGRTVATARVNRDRVGFITNDVGTQVAIGGDGNWDTFNDPVGGIAQWNASVGSPGVTSINVTVGLENQVIDGDILIVEFDVDLGFAGVATRSITLVAIGTGVTDWYRLEPNSYDDFGSEVETIAREPINPSRQKKKGVVVDLEADGGFNSDLTQTNLTRLMQGFFFADARERPTSNSLKGISVGIVQLTGTGIELTDAAQAATFKVDDIVRLSGFDLSSNNNQFVVTGVTGAEVEVTGLTADAAPAATAKIEVVGFSTATDTNMSIVDGKVRLTSATTDWTTLGMTVGEWICIGGDDAGSRYDNNAPGFARITSIGNAVLQLDQPSWLNPQDEVNGGAKNIHVYFGTVIRNEKEADLIKCRSYQLERTLGSDTAGVQSEYLVGAVANEMTLNVPSTDKAVVDMSFVALDNELRNGSQGIKTGNRNDAPIEDAFNTSEHILQMRLYVHDDTQPLPASLFGFVQEADITINNNVTGLKAIGTLGSFDINVGDFEVGGELNVYFATVEAVRAVRNNADVGFNMIGVRDNAGWVFDIPLLALGGGRANVEKDNPIMLPLEEMAGENKWGYTMLSSWFGYLPNAVMDN